jgi:hypothetical protein
VLCHAIHLLNRYRDCFIKSATTLGYILCCCCCHCRCCCRYWLFSGRLLHQGFCTILGLPLPGPHPTFPTLFLLVLLLLLLCSFTLLLLLLLLPS